jgi:hypothetical protein
MEDDKITPPGGEETEKNGGMTLFDVDQYDNWRPEWKGMPEFVQKDLTSWKKIIVHFENRADMDAFSAAIEQRLTDNTRSIWFPEAEIGHFAGKSYNDEETVNEDQETKRTDLEEISSKCAICWLFSACEKRVVVVEARICEQNKEEW